MPPFDGLAKHLNNLIFSLYFIFTQQILFIHRNAIVLAQSNVSLSGLNVAVRIIDDDAFAGNQRLFRQLNALLPRSKGIPIHVNVGMRNQMVLRE